VAGCLPEEAIIFWSKKFSSGANWEKWDRDFCNEERGSHFGAYTRRNGSQIITVQLELGQMIDFLRHRIFDHVQRQWQEIAWKKWDLFATDPGADCGY
jgi:hypothetical protein